MKANSTQSTQLGVHQYARAYVVIQKLRALRTAAGQRPEGGQRSGERVR